MKTVSRMRAVARALLLAQIVSLGLAAAPVAAADIDPHPEDSGTITAGDMIIYYAVLPAGVIATFPGSSTERQMHGGVPSGRHVHHILVALFDRETYERITDASVIARIGEIGLPFELVTLEPFDVAGSTTFGNYFEFFNLELYDIKLRVTRPGTADPVEAEFNYRHH